MRWPWTLTPRGIAQKVREGVCAVKGHDWSRMLSTGQLWCRRCGHVPYGDLPSYHETQRVVEAATVLVGEYVRAAKAGLIDQDGRLVEAFTELQTALAIRNTVDVTPFEEDA